MSVIIQLVLFSLVLISSTSSLYLPIRIVHAVLDGPPFDVVINNVLAFSNVSRGQSTSFYDPGHPDSMGGLNGTLVAFYHVGSRKSYFNQALIGSTFQDGTNRGMNATATVTGLYTQLGSSGLPSISPVAFYTTLVPSPTLSWLRIVYLGALSTEKLNVRLFYLNRVPTSKMDLQVSPQQVIPFSALVQGVYSIQMNDSTTNQLLWQNSNFVVSPGKTYTFVGMGSTVANITISPFTVLQLEDDSSTSPPVPVPTPSPEKKDPWRSLFYLAAIPLVFVAGVIITVIIMKLMTKGGPHYQLVSKV